MTCNHDDVWVTQHADHITWEWKGDTGYALVQREVMELLLARCNEPTYAAGVQAAREAVVERSMTCLGPAMPGTEWVHTPSVLAAIDALRNDSPDSGTRVQDDA